MWGDLPGSSELAEPGEGEPPLAALGGGFPFPLIFPGCVYIRAYAHASCPGYARITYALRASYARHVRVMRTRPRINCDSPLLRNLESHISLRFFLFIYFSFFLLFALLIKAYITPGRVIRA